MDASSFWALVGVGLGFALGEGSRLLRHWSRIARIKKLIRVELQSIRMQIPQKQEVMSMMIDALNQHQIMSGITVGIINTGYHQHGFELYEHLSSKERNCLHVIHERLDVADKMLSNFMEDFQAAARDKVIADPFATYKGFLEELQGSYKVVDGLILSYLDRKPSDVFFVEKPKGKK